MIAITDQKARLLDLVTGVLEMTRDGDRDIESVSSVLQTIKDNVNFMERLHSAPNLKRDMRREGWKLLEHTPRRLTSASNLEGISFLKSGETSVNGEEMVRRARIELDANYGQEDAEYLLEHQGEIPADLRPYVLVFTATVWEASHGRRLVAFLHWRGERWYLDFLRLGHGWHSGNRLPRPRK